MATEVAKLALSAAAQGVGPILDKIMDENFRVTCYMEIENCTEHKLTDAKVETERGEVAVPPSPSIDPKRQDVMLCRKTAFTATGSCGTVSWLVEGLNRRVYVMWSAPFNFDFYKNTLGVGIGGPEHPKYLQAFEEMYEQKKNGNLRFLTHKYTKNVDTVRLSDDILEIEGTMSTLHKALVKIKIRSRQLQ